MIERGAMWAAGASVLLFLIAIVLQIATTIKQQSLTWDEGNHLFAGYMSWKTGDFGLNPEHPPLVKLLAAAPLLDLPLQTPPLQNRFFKQESYFDGREFLFGNGPAYPGDVLLMRARLAAGSLTLALALLVFFATREMFGMPAGVIALGLFAFEPNLLAHGAYVTTDIGASCFFFASVYAFYRYVKAPSLAGLAFAGIATGLALASKHSTVLLAPTLVLLAIAEPLLHRHPAPAADGVSVARRVFRLLSALAAIGLIAIAVLWAFYGFRYAARPSGLTMNPPLAEYAAALKPVEAQGIALAAQLHLLPESYLYGLVDVRLMASGMPSYFFGEVYTHGLWFYFPVLMTIKLTLGLLALVVLAIVSIVTGKVRTREALYLVLPVAVYLAVAMASKLNIGSRHLLPVYLFLCVLAAGGAWGWIRSATGRMRKGAALTVALLLLLHTASSLHAHPDYIAYSNEIWGGPTQTYRYLSDSNTDWAQQLKAVKRYIDEHGIRECWFAYFAAPFIVPADYGISCRLLPTADSQFAGVPYSVPETIEGVVFISAGTLSGFGMGSNLLNPYRDFQALTPEAFIQDGVFVYRGRFALPLAAALSRVQAAHAALKAQDIDEAVAAAREAVRIAPGRVQTEIALGDAFAAQARRAEPGPGKDHADEARAAYERARAEVRAMEAGAQIDWHETLDKKEAALRR